MLRSSRSWPNWTFHQTKIGVEVTKKIETTVDFFGCRFSPLMSREIGRDFVLKVDVYFCWLFLLGVKVRMDPVEYGTDPVENW